MSAAGQPKQHVPIFVGSTYEDLIDYRAAVRDALHRLGTVVRGMEYFGSKPGTPKEECLKTVGSCRIYIGIFAMRYGSIDPGSGKSMTHVEYDEACRLKLPALIYLIDEERQAVLPKFVETGKGGERLRALKDELKKRHTVSFFTSSEDLARRVAQDLPPLLQQSGLEVTWAAIPRAADRLAGRPPSGRIPRAEGAGLRELGKLGAGFPDIAVSVLPDEDYVEAVAQQIKLSGRAYSLYGIAQTVLQKTERYWVACTVKESKDGETVQPLFMCALDEGLWLSEDEAVAHVLKKHFDSFYQAERTATEPPRGKYTFVAKCGLSGIILGPPNHHDYQTQLHKVHTERFSRMPFEEYKSRVRIVRDEEVVRKWVEEQSWKTDYLCLRVPGLVRLESLTSVENHFRDIHKRSVVQSVKSHRFRCDGATLSLSNPGLVGLVRAGLEEEERCTLEITAALEEHFASLGLQFFDAAWGGLHVAAALPSYLDVTSAGLSEGVRRIIGYVQANPGCTRRQVMEFLVGSPAPSNGQNAEELAVAQDFQWLLHHGCIIEFGNGSLETARPCRSP